MTKEELEKEAEKKYCNGCKWRIEQCLWAWRKTNGLKEPNEKNCSCKEVPAYLAGAEPREKRIADLEKENAELKKKNLDTQDAVTMQMYTNKANKEIADRQLTKAKEIIKELMSFSVQLCDCRHTVDFEKTREEAEQFLNSEVEK